MKKEATNTDLHELLMHVVEHMATKEETATKADLENGLASIREEMATKEDLANGLASIREEMATKTEMSAGFASVRSEISEVKQPLKDLEETVESHSGFAKEIDHNLTRTVAIERHLGLHAS